MTPILGRILEFRLEPDGRKSPRLACDPKNIPAPGKYLVAHIPGDDEAILPVTLFLQEKFADGFVAAPNETALPYAWDLGAAPALRGPLGKGFKLPGILRNLALVAAGDTAARLLPLIEHADSTALFTDLPVPDLPTQVEIQPLYGLPDALAWADFLAVDIPMEHLDRLPGILGLSNGTSYPPGQVLIKTPMPCGGLAECGVCTLTMGRKTILLCEDGPVVDLGGLI